MNPVSPELLLKLRRTVTERCRDRIDSPNKEKVEVEEHGITSKRKRNFFP